MTVLGEVLGVLYPLLPCQKQEVESLHSRYFIALEPTSC